MKGDGPRLYRISGWVLESSLAMPELGELRPDGDGTTADVRIRMLPSLGSPPAAYAVDGEPGRLCLDIPRVGRFTVRGGSDVEVEPLPEAAEMDLRAFLLGPVWAALNYQRGRLPLHASACARGGRAILFCGPSGAGKSSLMAALARSGLVPVADDTCVLDFSASGVPRIAAGVPRHKLWPDAVDHLGMAGDGSASVVSWMPKQQLAWESGAGDWFEIAAILLPEWGELARDRLTGAAAVRRLATAAVYRVEILDRLFPVEEYWRRLIELVRVVPVYRLCRPRGWDRFEASIELLRGCLGHTDAVELGDDEVHLES